MVAAIVTPLWDTVADFTAGPPNVPGASSVSLNSGGTLVQAWDMRRGRQYELGNAEAGTFAVSLFDPKENANPLNTSSPWNSGSNTLLPYRCIQRVGYWNPASNNTAGNLLNSTNMPPSGTIAYDPSFETTVAWLNNFGSAATFVQSTAQAFDGTHSAACTLTAVGDSVAANLWTVPGQKYTVSVYVYVPATYAVQLSVGQLSPTIVGYANGNATSTVTGAWQRLSVTVTATNAVSWFSVHSATAPSFPFTFYLDACQVELATNASTFTTAGPKRYPRYTGYIERYPQTWVDAGFRGVKPLEAVDALSILSRTVINQSYQSTILADSPYVYIPYNDKSGPQQVILPQGGQPTQGYTSLGVNGAVNFQGDTFLDGTPAVVVTQPNSNPPIGGNTSYITYLGTYNGVMTMNPQAFTLEVWVKVSAGWPYFGAAAIQPGENINGEPYGPQYGIGWYSFGNPGIGWNYDDPNGTSGSGPLPNQTFKGYADSTWHYFAIQMKPTGLTVSVDGNFGGTASLTPSVAIALTNFYIDAQTYDGPTTTSISVANMAAYPYTLSNAQITNHYNRGAGYINEVSGARVARLLTAYWSATNFTAAPGIIQMAPDFNYDPVGSPASARTVLDVVQEISTTENGFVWANTAGKVVWEDRSTRVAQQTSVATLGQGGGQIHFADIEFDYDPTYVYSQVNLTRPANSNYAPQVNATSLANYGQRILSATLQVNSDFDLGQAASFYLQRYAAPGGAPGTGTGPRIRKLVLDPAADPSMWTFILGLDLSQRLTVSFTTSTGLAMTHDYYVENIAESGDPAQRSYTVELQLSPVFVPNSFVLGDSTYGVLGGPGCVVY